MRRDTHNSPRYGGCGGTVEVVLVLAKEVEGEADVVGIAKPRGHVLHLAGVAHPHMDHRQVTNMAGIDPA